MFKFTRTNAGQRSFANANDIREVFRENRAELEWIAYFITGDSEMAAGCVAKACSESESHTSVFQEWLLTWARHATIRSAIDSQREQIKQISSNYTQPRFIRQIHEPLRAEAIEFVIAESESLVVRLDVVCRVTLVVSGVYAKCIADAALMIGIPLGGVQAAYRTAMDVIESARHQYATHDDVGPVLWNRA